MREQGWESERGGEEKEMASCERDQSIPSQH